MKNRVFLRTLHVSVAMLFFGLYAAMAQNPVKTDTTSMATNTANWILGDGGSGVVPTPTQIGEFDATASANSLANMTLGGVNVALGGLQLDTNMAGPLVISDTKFLDLGTSGINMTAADQNLTIDAPLRGGTSQTWNVVSNLTLTINGSVLLDESSSAANTDPFFGVSGTQALTITGSGTVNVPNSILEPNFTGSGTGIGGAGVGVFITGGTFNGAGVLIQRSSSGIGTPSLAAPITVPTTEGFVVNGSNTLVTLGTVTIGGGFGNNPGTMSIQNGNTTVTGGVILGDTAGNSNPARWGGFEVAGGTFTALDTNIGVVISQSDGGVLNPMELVCAGGITTLGQIVIGSQFDPTNATNNAEIFVNGGALYMGSGGIFLGNSSPHNAPFNGTNGYFISLLAGTLGAQASWSTALNMIMSSSTGLPFTIQTADSNNVPHNITLGGVISGASTAPLTVTGGGILTLANTNTFSGIPSINGGIVNVAAPENPGVSGPLGQQLASAAGTILFGGGTLQFSSSNQNDYSGRLDNGTLGNPAQPWSFDLAGQNVTFASALQGASSSLLVNDSVGGGTLTLSGANAYTGGTVVNSGTLNVASGTGTGPVTVTGTGILAGSGTISGPVTVSGGETYPGAEVAGTTTTYGGNVTYSGGSAVFDLSSSATGAGNDEIVLNGAGAVLSCAGSVTVDVTSLSGLDTVNGHSYTLFSVPNGTISGAFGTTPILIGNSSAVLHPTFYSVQKVGNTVQLIVSAVNPPVVSNQIATPSSLSAFQSFSISATVTPGDFPISSVVVNLSALGLSSAAPLNNTSGNTWSGSFTVQASALPGSDSLGLTATDDHTPPTSTTVPVLVTVNGTSETWDGLQFGSSPNWTIGPNWTSGLSPGFGDNVFFNGSTGLTPVMNQSYTLAGVTFNSGAGSFSVTNNGNNGVLTLTGGATNNSSVTQALNLPVAVGASSVAVNGVVLGGVVSGPNLDTLSTSGNVTLGTSNTFAGTVAPSGGTLTLGSSLSLQDSTLNNSAGSVGFGTLTTASIGALTGSANLSLLNSSTAPVALSIGANNTSKTFSGGLTGSGASLTVSGTGTTTFTGVNTYTGPTTNGATSTLIIGGAGQLGGGTYAGSFNNAGVLTFNTTANQTLSGIISGTGPIFEKGPGSLTLNGASTYTGPISINAGTLTIGSAGELGSGTYTPNLLNNGTLTYSSSAAQTLSGTISGTGALNVTGTGKLTLGGANTFTGKTTTGVGSTLQLNNSLALKNSLLSYSTGTLLFGNGVTLVNIAGLTGTSNTANLALVDSGNPVTLNIVNSANQSFAGTISDGGLGGSILTGGAVQTLTGTNTFQGGITILSGTLTIGGAGLLGGGNFTGVLSPQTGATFIWNSSAAQTLGGLGFEGGGSIQVTGTGVLTTVTSNALSGGGSFSIAKGSTFTVAGGGQLEAAGYTGAYAEAIANNGTFNYNSSNITTLSGTITGVGTINVGGPGELALTGTGSSYSNTITTVTGGILSYSNDGATTNANGAPGVVPLTVTTNIILNGGDLMGTGSFTLNSNRDIGLGASSGSAPITALIDAANGTFTIAGALVPNGSNKGVISLMIDSEPGSSGTVVLTATNTFTGNITISNGILSIANAGTLGTNGIFSGNITNNDQFDYSSSTNLTLSGDMSDGLVSPGSLNIGASTPASGAPIATLTLLGTNTFSGPINDSGGSLIVGGNGLLGNGNYANQIGIFSGATLSSLSINTTQAQTLSGGIDGNGSLNHNGTGKLTLSGNLGYNGPTTNNEGTLALVGDGQSTGCLQGTSILAVNAPGIVDPTGLTSDGTLHMGDINIGQGNQTLTGNGSVLNNVIIATEGTLEPGPATGFGTLTIANKLTIGDGTNGGGNVIMNVDHPISGAVNDSVAAKSIAVLTNGSTPLPTLTVVQGTNDLETGDTFQLFNITGNSGVSSIKNLLSALTLPTTGPVSSVVYIWNTNQLATTGILVLTKGAPAVSPINPNPTNLLVTVSGDVLHLSWPPNHLGWQLQSNSVSLTSANWVTIPGSTNVTNENIVIPSKGNVFFRLFYVNP